MKEALFPLLVGLMFIAGYIVILWHQKKILKSLHNAPELLKLRAVNFQSDLFPDDLLMHLKKNSNQGFNPFSISKYVQLCGGSFWIHSTIRKQFVRIMIAPTGRQCLPYCFNAAIIGNPNGTQIEGKFQAPLFIKIFKWVALIMALVFLAFVLPVLYLEIRAGDWVVLSLVFIVGAGIIFYIRSRGPDIYELWFKQIVLEYTDKTLGTRRI